MEEKTIEVVVDGVTIPLEEELKEFLKRRLSVEQPGKRRKLSSGPPLALGLAITCFSYFFQDFLIF